MGVKRDILAILSDRQIYDTLGIKNNLFFRNRKYRYLSLQQIAICLRRMEKDGDVKIVTRTRYNRWGRAQPGRKLIACQITHHGLKKIEYLYKKGLVDKKMITALR